MKKPERIETACFIEGAEWCHGVILMAIEVARPHAPKVSDAMLDIANSLLEGAKAAAIEKYPEHAPLSDLTKRPNLGY